MKCFNYPKESDSDLKMWISYIPEPVLSVIIFLSNVKFITFNWNSDSQDGGEVRRVHCVSETWHDNVT